MKEYSVDNIEMLNGLKFRVSFDSSEFGVPEEFEKVEYTISNIISSRVEINWVDVNSGKLDYIHYNIETVVENLNNKTWVTRNEIIKEKLKKLEKCKNG